MPRDCLSAAPRRRAGGCLSGREALSIWYVRARPAFQREKPAADDELLALLKPCPDEAPKIWQVGKGVGNVKNTGPQLAMSLAV